MAGNDIVKPTYVAQALPLNIPTRVLPSRNEL